MSTMEQDISLTELDPDDIGAGEELYLISEATNGDGTIDVKILGWEKRTPAEGAVAEVEFMTPSGNVEVEEMAWPSRDSTEYKFVRLCQQYGHGVVDPDGLKSKRVPAVEDDGEWELSVEKKVTLRERLAPCFDWFTMESILKGFDIAGVFMCMTSVIGGVLSALAVLVGVASLAWLAVFVAGFICGMFLVAIGQGPR